MPQKSNHADDQKVLQELRQGVKPYTHTKVKIEKSQPDPKLKPKNKKYSQELDNFYFSDHEYLEPVSSNELIQYSKPGIHYKTLRNLRKGEYNVDATLDLHGMRVDSARQALSDFLAKSQAQGLRHLLVIHGKGKSSKPILKNKLNHWLREINSVLAFCSATPLSGSSGALYILLRNST